MREIEVKAKVNNIREIEQSLITKGCEISEVISQKDQIFLPLGVKFENISTNTNVLRIRQQGGIIMFTLKRHLANELDCIEREIEIKDVQTMTQILADLGYYEAVRVAKTRRKCRFQDLEICLDVVDGLGEFIEAEKMSDNDGETVQADLFKFLKTLGVQEEDRVYKGYDKLIHEKET